MKLTKQKIKQFEDAQAMSGTKNALTEFGDVLAGSFLTKITKSQAKQLEAEQKEFGVDKALFFVIYDVAIELFNDIGVNAETSDKPLRKILPPAIKSDIGVNDVTQTLNKTKQKTKLKRGEFWQKAKK